MESIDISIIIVTYNNYSILKECIQSIVKFSAGINFEIIIIDNSTFPQQLDFIDDSLLQKISIIQNKKNIGFAAANNQGIKLAKGNYLFFLNDDTVFIENSLKKLLNFSDTLNRYAIVGCKLLNKDKSHQHSIVDFPSILNTFTESFFLYKIFPKKKLLNKYWMNYFVSDEPVKVDVVLGAAMFCNKNLINELKGFDERFFFYSEETDLCKRAKEIGNKVYFFPGTSIIHLGGSSTKKNVWFKFKNQTIGKIKYYQKHFSGMQFVLILSLHYIGLLLRGFYNLFLGILLLNKNLLQKSYYFFKQIFIYPPNEFN